MPRKLSVPGMVIAGDSATMVNIPELKGIHYAMHAGMYAAEEIVAALKREEVDFSAYDERVRNSVIGKDLYKWRNGRQPFSKGFFVGGAVASAMTVTQGFFPAGMWKQVPDSEEEMVDRRRRREVPQARRQAHLRQALLGLRLRQRHARRRPQPRPDPERTSRARSPRPGSRCARRRSTRSPRSSSRTAPPRSTSTSPPSNCVQCGAITAKGGRLTPPEGGDGPLYQEV